jgi:hypothetical protein
MERISTPGKRYGQLHKKRPFPTYHKCGILNLFVAGVYLITP